MGVLGAVQHLRRGPGLLLAVCALLVAVQLNAGHVMLAQTTSEQADLQFSISEAHRTTEHALENTVACSYLRVDDPERGFILWGGLSAESAGS